MPGKANGLMVDALHQTAVAGDHEGTMVDQIVAVDGVEMPLGDGHPDRHRRPLPQRSGRDLDSGKLEILGVARQSGCQAGESS